MAPLSAQAWLEYVARFLRGGRGQERDDRRAPPAASVCRSLQGRQHTASGTASTSAGPSGCNDVAAMAGTLHRKARKARRAVREIELL